ncbi:hypothetical protein Btru_003232 [Bulinus truncatus]|nr:hypothetical protein Btru_003232 [Bulinus truncatus]
MLKQLTEHIISKKSNENNVCDRHTKNSNVKVTRSSKANGLTVNVQEDLLNQNCEKRTSRVKTSLNRKEIISNHSDSSNSTNVFECDIILPVTHQKQALALRRKGGDASNTNSICHTYNDKHSYNEDSCFKNDESKLSLPSLEEDLTIKLSQGPLTSGSQEEPICDVRWDYGSPEIIKKIKKRRGHYSAESVKSTVANFNYSHHKPQETSNNFAAILHSRDFKTVNSRGRLHKAKESQLELSSNDDQCCGHSSDNEETLKTDINYWSDEDLFKDDSFLIEATCNAEKCVDPSLNTENKSDLFSGINSPISDLRNENGNHLTVTFSEKSCVVPSSCISYHEDDTNSMKISHKNSATTVESINPVQSLPIEPNKIQHNKMAGKNNLILTKKTSGAAILVNSKSSERNNAKASGNVSLKSSDGDSKVVLKKFNSFETTISPRLHISDAVVKTDGRHPEFNSPLRKTLSFDSSNAKRSAVPKAPANSYCPGYQKNCIFSNVTKSSSLSSGLMESQSLKCPPSNVVDDVNLPDDVLQKFLEPDEILDSQEANTVKPTDQNISAKGNTFQLKTVQNCGNNNSSNSKRFSSYSSNIFFKNSNRLQSANPSSKPAKTTLSSVSHAPGEQKTQSFKLVENVSKNLNPVSSGLVVHKNCLQKPGQKPATPLKSLKINGFNDSKQSEMPGASQQLSDSFIENAFDDSFLKDEAVFESQILPILDLVESEALKDSQCSQQPVSSPPASQQPVSSPPVSQQPVSSPPVQCSSEEIERKRQAALQKRFISLSQRK